MWDGRRRSSSTLERCGDCDSAASSVFCRQCNSGFCKPCCSKLHSGGVFRDHAVVLLERGQSGTVRLCPDHDWEKFTLFCSRCSCFVCVNCVRVGQHKGHDAKSMQRAVVEARERLQRQRATIEQSLRTLNKLRNENKASISNIKESSAAVEHEVRDKMDALRVALQSRHSAMLETVHAARLYQLDRITGRAAHADAALARLDGRLTALRELYMETDPTLFLSALAADASEEAAAAAVAGGGAGGGGGGGEGGEEEIGVVAAHSTTTSDFDAHPMIFGAETFLNSLGMFELPRPSMAYALDTEPCLKLCSSLTFQSGGGNNNDMDAAAAASGGNNFHNGNHDSSNNNSNNNNDGSNNNSNSSFSNVDDQIRKLSLQNGKSNSFSSGGGVVPLPAPQTGGGAGAAAASSSTTTSSLIDSLVQMGSRVGVRGFGSTPTPPLPPSASSSSSSANINSSSSLYVNNIINSNNNNNNGSSNNNNVQMSSISSSSSSPTGLVDMIGNFMTSSSPRHGGNINSSSSSSAAAAAAAFAGENVPHTPGRDEDGATNDTLSDPGSNRSSLNLSGTTIVIRDSTSSVGSISGSLNNMNNNLAAGTAPPNERLALDREAGMTDAMELERVSLVASAEFSLKDMTEEDRRLLWKHRVTLTENKKALLKLFSCTQWNNERHVRSLLDLIPRWVDVDVEDALELLGDAYGVDTIRMLALRSLSQVCDEELFCYLLSLVQAMRHDSIERSLLADFVISRCIKTPRLAIPLHWYLTVEEQSPTYGRLYKSIHAKLFAEVANANTVSDVDAATPLLEVLRRQDHFVAAINSLAVETKRYKESRPKQLERLVMLLSEGGAYSHLRMLSSTVNLPHQPDVVVSGIVAEECAILKSAMNPIKLVFRTPTAQEHCVLIKVNDDLRRDQLVLSTINLMDMLLKRDGMDLKLTTYKVTATTPDAGFVEFVPSLSLQRVLDENDNNIKAFLKSHHPSADGQGVDPVVMDTFVRSCAGYCVISFLLGLGDRHLDNLMLTTEGQLFHVDFEYILGNDPRPFAPPMKLCEPMVAAMGGKGSKDYQAFHKYCCKAYLILRKSARLFVNLFDLVADGGVLDRQGRVTNPSPKLLERFQLDLSKEAAVQYMAMVINESLGAIFPQVVDTFHRWRQYWKA